MGVMRPKEVIEQELQALSPGSEMGGSFQEIQAELLLDIRMLLLVQCAINQVDIAEFFMESSEEGEFSDEDF